MEDALQLKPPDPCVEILVQRNAVNDLRDLIILVVIVEGIGVQPNSAIMECILGANLESVHVLRLEIRSQGLILNDLGIDIDARRIGAASLVAPRV
ncbi:hypothetical protein D3C87_1918780 [compost metagenome]